MSRAGREGCLLGPREVADMPTEVALRGAPTDSLVGGLAFVDAKPKVDRKPMSIRALVMTAVFCSRSSHPPLRMLLSLDRSSF